MAAQLPAVVHRRMNHRGSLIRVVRNQGRRTSVIRPLARHLQGQAAAGAGAGAATAAARHRQQQQQAEPAAQAHVGAAACLWKSCSQLYRPQPCKQRSVDWQSRKGVRGAKGSEEERGQRGVNSTARGEGARRSAPALRSARARLAAASARAEKGGPGRRPPAVGRLRCQAPAVGGAGGTSGAGGRGMHQTRRWPSSAGQGAVDQPKGAADQISPTWPTAPCSPRLLSAAGSGTSRPSRARPRSMPQHSAQMRLGIGRPKLSAAGSGRSWPWPPRGTSGTARSSCRPSGSSCTARPGRRLRCRRRGEGARVGQGGRAGRGAGQRGCKAVHARALRRAPAGTHAACAPSSGPCLHHAACHCMRGAAQHRAGCSPEGLPGSTNWTWIGP